MGLVPARERAFARAVIRMGFCNPFLPERIAAERDALGPGFDERGAEWNLRGYEGDRPNVAALTRRLDTLLDAIDARLRSGARADERERAEHADLIVVALYYRYRPRLIHEIDASVQFGNAGRRPIAFYPRFAADIERYTSVSGAATSAQLGGPAHVFACYFQIVRAFRQIFGNLLGASRPAARFRAAVWQSIFTHDLRRFQRVLYDRMADATTLITGPTGTGKDLAARAIGLSRYIPFDPQSRSFAEDFAGSFFALNPTALSPTLIESELFGHRRGSFTGAVADRAGWLEVCPPLGSVFLDEIGELDPAIQVKLLRVLQDRVFQRIGDTKPRTFHGKIIAATNRDLAAEMQAGRFREDFYYRLCADTIVAPTLAEQIRDNPDELSMLLLFIARRLVGEIEAPALARDAQAHIDGHLGRDYAWPGNVRELEQCVRNVMIRGEYRPAAARRAERVDELLESVRRGALSADGLLRIYAGVVQAQTRNYSETARRLNVDRRTVRKWLAEP